jgi:hypothetical protein
VRGVSAGAEPMLLSEADVAGIKEVEFKASDDD